MVYYNRKAYDDLSNIFYGLIMWSKHPLAREHAMQYVDDIEKICKTLDCKPYHQEASYDIHKIYGKYVHLYKRNRNTCWYIIYNIDLFNDVFIEKIMNNYMTIK